MRLPDDALRAAYGARDPGGTAERIGRHAKAPPFRSWRVRVVCVGSGSCKQGAIRAEGSFR
jgi:hypothetical protein